MTREQSLYQEALLAWRRELVAQHELMLKDRQTKMRDALRQKLTEMFGPDYPIEMEGAHAKEELVLGAVVEDLNFLAIRGPSGGINVVLLVLCSRCGHQMPSAPLTRLADLGRELLDLEMKGIVGEHECPDTTSDGNLDRTK
jgi:hypothetical protein